MRYVVAALLLLSSAPVAQARPVVVELFTSQACSSCPPADALLARLAKSMDILPLSFSVTYWNSPAWTDSDSLQGATDRQNWYASLAGSQDVYTPEAVVDGTAQMVGSDAEKVTAAIAVAKASLAGDVPVSVKGGATISISIGAGSGNANVLLFGYDSQHSTRTGGGENDGATITEVNVVRSITSLGPWTGQQMSMSMSRPAGDHIAVLLQASNGAILGVGVK
jgi:hypothetical protein